MSTFRVEYRARNYTIADALHPDPRYKRRIFTVDSDAVGTSDLGELGRAAKSTAPDGYKLFRISEAKQ